ncbi:MAG: hypothetical protein LBK58_09420 [Prevotellaceae bacterium]|jgi:hypothetical protein|nr:hypothetical protein [Prevotellaceae bacterium]
MKENIQEDKYLQFKRRQADAKHSSSIIRPRPDKQGGYPVVPTGPTGVKKTLTDMSLWPSVPIISVASVGNYRLTINEKNFCSKNCLRRYSSIFYEMEGIPMS